MQNSTTPFSIAQRRQAEVKQLSHTRRGREQDKRDRLRAELAHEIEQPLTPGVTLTRRERAQERERVQTGISAQSFYARGGGAGTKTVDA